VHSREKENVKIIKIAVIYRNTDWSKQIGIWDEEIENYTRNERLRRFAKSCVRQYYGDYSYLPALSNEERL